MKGLRIKTLPYITMSSKEGFSGLGGKLKFPVVVKPACLGSSIGIMKAENTKEFERAYSYAMRYGEKAIVEPLLKNFIEINCGAYRDGEKIIVSECERPIARTEFLSFDDKYRLGKREFPANIEKDISDKIKAITEKVYENLCFDGVIRIDYFVLNGEIYLNEVNTVPGSLAYYLFNKTVKDYGVMLNQLIRQAEINFSARSTIQKSYQTGILNMKGCKGKNACKK
jgi:D-alanine-D-alanine ligase